MKAIWYLLKCPEENEREYVERCQKLPETENAQDIICFQYQRMFRYGGGWHLETRRLLPGCIFLSEAKAAGMKEEVEEDARVSLVPCKVNSLKSLCSQENLIGISRGIIKDGIPMVDSGPLKGREYLIRKIDRHKRTAQLEIPFADTDTRITVGLEIYEKQR